MKRPAVFLDRDGTINEQMGYINHVSRFALLPGVPGAIRLLNRYGVLAIIVSNQSGIGRGYFPAALVDEIHDHMRAILVSEGCRLDGIFICPHRPSDGCDCRKPKTGMIKRVQDRFDIDMSRSYVVGDRCTDMEFAHNAGLPGVLVTTGYGRGEVEYVLPGSPYKPVFIAADLTEAVTWVLGEDHE